MYDQKSAGYQPFVLTAGGVQGARAGLAIQGDADVLVIGGGFSGIGTGAKSDEFR